MKKMYYNMAQVEEAANTASSLHEKFLRNVAGVTEEDREGKYKNAFSKLKREITVAMATYCYENSLTVFNADPTLDQKALELTRQHLPAIMHALWNGGMEDAEKKVEEVRNIFLTEFYFPLSSKTLQA